MNSSVPEHAYVTSLDEIFWGAILVGVTMMLHGLGMLTVLRVNARLRYFLQARTTFIGDICVLILASWLILLVHLIEVLVWAAFFLWKNAFPNGSTSYYFSLNQYTTVGSSLGLPMHWRLLEGMIAAAGLLTFAWSTGVLLALAQDFQDRQMKSFQPRHNNPADLETKSR